MHSLNELTKVLDRLAACTTFAEAVDFLAEWARGYALCDVALVRMVAQDAEGTTAGPWIPACGQYGADPSFARDETFVAARDCMCGRVMLRDVNVSLPFFTERGSFVWGRVSSLGSRFGPEQIGPMRGRCIEEGYESLAIFPILDQGRPVGVLHLANRDPDKFEDSAELIEEVCARAGTILFRHHTAEMQHALIEAIRAALSPAQPPRISGLDLGACSEFAGQASHVGGDFYDVIELAQDGVLLVVGDYSGKGLEAAGVASQARYVLASLVSQSQGLADLLERANRRLSVLLPYDRFVSVAACLIRPATGDLRLALAGHPAPVLLKEGGEIAELPAPAGPPLGAFSDSRYKEVHFELDRRDILLIYTDGVTEARRGGGFFGLEGIASVWSAWRGRDLGILAHEICRAASRFHDQDLPTDDRLVVAAKLTPAMVSLRPNPEQLARMAVRQ